MQELKELPQKEREEFDQWVVKIQKDTREAQIAEADQDITEEELPEEKVA